MLIFVRRYITKRLMSVPSGNSSFILFIYLAGPTRAGSPQQHMPITVGPLPNLCPS
jgi:hypothetical protein